MWVGQCSLQGWGSPRLPARPNQLKSLHTELVHTGRVWWSCKDCVGLLLARRVRECKLTLLDACPAVSEGPFSEVVSAMREGYEDRC